MPEPVKEVETPVPALDEVGEGPEIPEDENEEVEHPMIGDAVNANEWGDEIGDEL